MLRAFNKVVNELSKLSSGVCDDVIDFEDKLAELHNRSYSTAHFFTSDGNLTSRMLGDNNTNNAYLHASNKKRFLSAIDEIQENHSSIS